jgi:hypothetical protein
MEDTDPSRRALETAIDRADECRRRERCRWVGLVNGVKLLQCGAEPPSVAPFGFNHDVEALCCANHTPGGNGEPPDYDETNAVALERRRDCDRIEGLIRLHVGPDGTAWLRARARRLGARVRQASSRDGAQSAQASSRCADWCAAYPRLGRVLSGCACAATIMTRSAGGRRRLVTGERQPPRRHHRREPHPAANRHRLVDVGRVRPAE